ncbi:MAG: hydrolase [Fibrobacteres bacterium]|nr:hydrolase [Fibrobacterota bacterium]
MTMDSKTPLGDEPERLRQAPKYRAWRKSVEKNGCVIKKVELLQDLNKGDGSLLFALLRTRVEDPQGRPLPAYALIRGHAALIVTEVVNRETGEKKFLMLRQRRIGHGGDALEFPAGMLDEDVADPLGVALKELKEETGLDARRDQMVPLLERPLYSSAGLDDEAIFYFGCSLDLPSDEFHALEGGEKGKSDENEYIRLGLWEYEKALPEVDSIQVWLGFSLWFEHQRRVAAKRA